MLIAIVVTLFHREIVTFEAIAIRLDLLIGGITFTGSAIACAKLQELMPGWPIVFPGLKLLNPRRWSASVAIVIGANDIVNSAALDEPASPIYGMPIIRSDLAARLIIMKRSMASGFSGIENDLFCREKSYMLFGDAKATITALERRDQGGVGSGGIDGAAALSSASPVRERSAPWCSRERTCFWPLQGRYGCRMMPRTEFL